MSREIIIKPFSANMSSLWNTFLSSTKMPLFLFNREYMDYHADRFVDCSAIGLIGERVNALFPASIDLATGVATSHGGLTFGGPLLAKDVRGVEVLDLVGGWLDWLRAQNVTCITVKLIPSAFATYAADEVAYALWRYGFSLNRRDFSSILPILDRRPFNSSKKAAIKKATKLGLILNNPSIAVFHNLLTTVLRDRHQVVPVHSQNELEILASRFPGRIFVRGASIGDTLMGAALVFDYGHIWHTQYLAVSDVGRETGALDLVIADLIQQAEQREVRSLSFGTSSESAGTTLNEGLLWQKESYGARGLVHDFMTLAF